MQENKRVSFIAIHSVDVSMRHYAVVIHSVHCRLWLDLVAMCRPQQSTYLPSVELELCY